MCATGPRLEPLTRRLVTIAARTTLEAVAASTTSVGGVVELRGTLNLGAVGASDVDGAQAAILADDVELDSLAIGERAEAVGSDVGLVNEEILTAVGGVDEAEALLGVEPLDSAGLTLRRREHAARDGGGQLDRLSDGSGEHGDCGR